MKKLKKSVAIGLSGGVDSAVAAHLLQKEGYNVIAFFMKNWEETGEKCPAEQDYLDALAVAEQLNIPLYSFNFAKEYFTTVFQDLIDGLKKGITPNPDILCNKEIKFSVFLKKALSLGADYLATGHYANISENFELQRGLDQNKDQSYFLYTLKKEILKKTIFPIGKYQKQQIRSIAKDLDLPVFNKKDSTGICFIGKRNFSEFIANYMPPTKGCFKDFNGNILGEHSGAWFYTIGQRKGLGIGGKGDAWYVYDKDIKTHTVYLVQGGSDPLLFKSVILLTNFTFVENVPIFPLQCTAKIRYRTNDEICTMYKEKDHIKVIFKTPQKGVTPGQSIVFYNKSICLGGGIINTYL